MAVAWNAAMDAMDATARRLAWCFGRVSGLRQAQRSTAADQMWTRIFAANGTAVLYRLWVVFGGEPVL